MKTLILTFAIILTIIAISALSLFAQDARPGQPIKGVIVKGGQNPTSLAMPGQPIGGIVVKGGHNGLVISDNPLYDSSGNTAQNPLNEMRAHSDMDSAGACTNPYYKENSLTGEVVIFVAGTPIGGIIVKGGSNAVAGNVSPLYDAQGLEVTSALYQGGGH
ncbi:MAG: hypothetical protein V4619_10600 [Bacteroidota bacterium]